MNTEHMPCAKGEQVEAGKKQIRIRYIPVLRNLRLRTTIGFFLLVLSVAIAQTIYNKGQVDFIVTVNLVAWLVAVFITHKYIHKYPQRYFTYLIASHMKAALIMGLLIWMVCNMASDITAPSDVVWTGFFLFVFMDILISIPRRLDIPEKRLDDVTANSGMKNRNSGQIDVLDNSAASQTPIEIESIVRKIQNSVSDTLVEFIDENMTGLHGNASEVLILDSHLNLDKEEIVTIEPVDIIVSNIRINDVRRINKYLLYCTNRMNVGGYIIGRYIPHENIARELRCRYTGLRYWSIQTPHFIWHHMFPKIPWLNALYFALTKGSNRILSKAEIWGRLSYCGMKVIVESMVDNEIYFIAQRVTHVISNKKPSYYPIVALEKVGLDGEIIKMHKIRSMYPFSEFLQKRIFEDHGLTSTGKFKDDFRLTSYGKFIRKYWLDELPQIYDWLRGEVKLVGIRATSKQYLSLYPEELYDLYIQIKPGLIPPIFDESTDGFDKIVEVELTYLQRFIKDPIKTDVSYFIQTFRDIALRGIRSK